jgi:hypothetical protein
VHSLGYVEERTQEVADDFFPGYAHTMTEIGKERGWPEVTRVKILTPSKIRKAHCSSEIQMK